MHICTYVHTDMKLKSVSKLMSMHKSGYLENVNKLTGGARDVTGKFCVFKRAKF